MRGAPALIIMRAILHTLLKPIAQDVTPPDSVKPAFNEVNESRQDKERTINIAQERANREIPKARGVAKQSIGEAEGYALERINRAEGEATRFSTILAGVSGHTPLFPS